MKNIFLNILVLLNPNYKNIEIIGTVNKNISLIEQFIIFYNSIKKNLNKIKYDISILYYDDFNNKDLEILQKLDINLIKTNIKNFSICSLQRYITKTKIKGTHRLIAECDMVLLKEPIFNFNVDFQAMYAGNILYPEKEINYIKKFYNLNINKDIDIKNKQLFIEYNIYNKKKNELFPHFNNGLKLVTEEFAIKFYNKVIDLNIINNFPLEIDKIYKHHFNQFIYSLILVNLTNNWEPFHKGINYLIKVYDVLKFKKENIILLHYCGKNGYKIYKELFT